MPAPLLTGGGQEKGHRGGTENLLPASPVSALLLIAAEGLAGSFADRALRDEIEGRSCATAPDVIMHGIQADRLANTVSFRFPA
jgi:cysteine desulfurase